MKTYRSIAILLIALCPFTTARLKAIRVKNFDLATTPKLNDEKYLESIVKLKEADEWS